MEALPRRLRGSPPLAESEALIRASTTSNGGHLASEAGTLETDPGLAALGDVGIWRNRGFLLLWLAQVISQTAQNAIWYGIFVLVQQRSNSTTQLSLAVLTLTVPSVIFGVLAGVYVDRWDKRAVLIGSNVLRGAVALLYTAYGMTDALPLLGLYAVNFVFQTIGQFFAPAEAAMIPVLVGRNRLLQANSLFHLTFTASQLAGLVVLGPLLVKVISPSGLFGLMALSIIVCGVLVWPLPSRRARDPGAPATGIEAVSSIWQDARAVSRFVLRDRLVTLVMVQWTIGAILGLVVATLVPGFAERLLRVRAEDAVFVMAPAGVGMLVGTGLMNRWAERVDRSFLALAGLWLVAACLGGLGAATLLVEMATGAHPPLVELPGLGLVSGLVPLVMLVALLAGFGFVAIMVPTQTLLQERAPVELRGRVFGVLFMLNNLANIPPLLLLGGLADLIGVDRTLILLGGLVGIAALVSLRVAPGVPPWRKSPSAAEVGSGLVHSSDRNP